MIEYINGDILIIESDIIAHQVNCMGKFAKGLALQIRKKYKEVYTEYMNLYNSIDNKSELMGECQIIKTYDGKYVANIFSQYNFYPKGVRHTDYDALEQSLKFLKFWMKGNKIKTCGIPLIGCGLAGGDWDGVVHPMLKDIFEKDENVKLVIVKFKK